FCSPFYFTHATTVKTAVWYVFKKRAERGTESIKGQEFHVHPRVILFLVGGIVTLQLAVVCLDRLESALGVDFLSRA
ncbi:hypothetical protein ACC754_44760, partial [Rhizobium johnstonii]